MASISETLIQRRILFLLLVMLLVTGLLVIRLGYLQIWQNEFYQAKALEQRIQRIPVEGLRGTIYDRNGVPLALSVAARTVYAIPAEVEDAQATAQALAGLLDLEEDFLLQRLTKNSATEWLKKKISEEDARKITDLNLPGIGVVPTSVRIYPYGSIAPKY